MYIDDIFLKKPIFGCVVNKLPLSQQTMYLYLCWEKYTKYQNM
jgi:hypothetical protein